MSCCDSKKNEDHVVEVEATAFKTAQMKIVGRTTATVNPGTISANTVFESSSITLTGAIAGDYVLVAPIATLPANLSTSGYVSASDTVKIRIANASVGGVAVSSGTWGVAVVR